MDLPHGCVMIVMFQWIHWWKIHGNTSSSSPNFSTEGCRSMLSQQWNRLRSQDFSARSLCMLKLPLIWIKKGKHAPILQRNWSRCLGSFGPHLLGVAKKTKKEWTKYTLSHPHTHTHKKRTSKLKKTNIMNPSCYLKHSWTRTLTILKLRFPLWMLWTWLQFQRFRSRWCRFLKRSECPPTYPSENPSHGQQL